MDSQKKPATKCSDGLHKGFSFLSIVSMLFTVLLFLRMEAINLKTEMIDQRLGKRIWKVESNLKMGTLSSKGYGSKIEVSDDTKKNTEKRARRSSVGNSTRSVTTQDVRYEITKQWMSLINPAIFCQPSEKLCVPGPPGKKGNRGSRGKRGARGFKGNKGVQGIVGLPGRHGKRGSTGNPGAEGQKGVKGDIGPRGMPGLKGEPGGSISAPEVIVSPESQTVTENQTAIFYCSASGTPNPKVTWKKVNGSFTERHVFSETNGGKLEIRSPGYNDSGQYACAASNIFGRDRKIVQLVVEGPPILIKTPAHFVAINEKTTAKLTCEASGFPPSVTQWTRAFSSLPVGRSTDINGTLSIAEFRSEDTGTYVCTATNRFGSARSLTVLGIELIPQGSCDEILKGNSNLSNGTHEILPGVLKLKVYCDMTADRKGWTLIARFSNNDNKTWMNDTGYWWYDQQVAMGTTTNPSVNADMISPAFWLVSGREFKITRSDDPSHTPLLQTTGICLGRQTFRSKVTSYGDFRNGKFWSSNKCLGSCTVQYGGMYKSTDGFQQAECSSDIQSSNKIGFWCDWSDGDGSVMMIGGGGSGCSRADHGIGITEAGEASFIDDKKIHHDNIEYDFGYDGITSNQPTKVYSLNLWVQ